MSKNRFSSLHTASLIGPLFLASRNHVRAGSSKREMRNRMLAFDARLVTHDQLMSTSLSNLKMYLSAASYKSLMKTAPKGLFDAGSGVVAIPSYQNRSIKALNPCQSLRSPLGRAQRLADRLIKAVLSNSEAKRTQRKTATAFAFRALLESHCSHLIG